MEGLKKYLYALSVYCGTIIGAGIFGLPYVASKSGFFIILVYFIILGFLVTVSALMYGELTSRTKDLHRLPGYAEIYLGKKFKIVSLVSGIIGIIGSLLVYIIIGGNFLGNLALPVFGGQMIFYIIAYILIGTVIIYFGNKALAQSELIMLFIFIGIIFYLFIKSLPHVQFTSFQTGDMKYLFLPYGVVLFSISGNTIIPELSEILGKKYQNYFKSVIIAGVMVSTVVYIIFIFSILGISGGKTSQDALSGLESTILAGSLSLFYLFGFLTTFTSFISLGMTLKKMLWYDLKIPHFISWLIVAAVPVILYFLGANNFIVIISLLGAITLGIDIILLFLIHHQAKFANTKKPVYQINLPKIIIGIFIFLFLLGIILELLTIKFH